ncbi:hypothetical protein RRF57_009249 [Xylaria bambusicola]|uniref:Uncharacterized protein n=1 Tax=Xylaria bambusicola TaxID=326684 RepID=A0AAN7UJ99_9PEZI
MPVALPPTLVMREHDLNIRSLSQLVHSPIDRRQRLFRQKRMYMHASHPAATVLVLGNFFFSAQDPGVVTAVAAKIDVLLLAGTHEQVDVPVDMPGTVDDVDAFISEEVDGAGKPRKGLPRPCLCRGR